MREAILSVRSVEKNHLSDYLSDCIIKIAIHNNCLLWIAILIVSFVRPATNYGLFCMIYNCHRIHNVHNGLLFLSPYVKRLDTLTFYEGHAIIKFVYALACWYIVNICISLFYFVTWLLCVLQDFSAWETRFFFHKLKSTCSLIKHHHHHVPCRLMWVIMLLYILQSPTA